VATFRTTEPTVIPSSSLVFGNSIASQLSTCETKRVVVLEMPNRFHAGATICLLSPYRLRHSSTFYYEQNSSLCRDRVTCRVFYKLQCVFAQPRRGTYLCMGYRWSFVLFGICPKWRLWKEMSIVLTIANCLAEKGPDHEVVRPFFLI
jgi:hypothetical protein